MQSIIMHVDMNSYFASVEQQANPLLRHRPVGVCAYLSANGCIIAASIEAKKIGVKTGMRVSVAKTICPHIILLANDPDKYRFVSRKIFSLLKKISDEVEIYSIDEAFINLTGLVNDFSDAKKIAIQIKQAIKQQVGSYLTCSIGISYTRWLAKFASEENKPDGLTVIDKNDLQSIFKDRPLQHAWGIGQAMENRLHLLGIDNLYQLQHSSPDFLKKNLGWYGYYLWCHLNGLAVEVVDQQRNQIPKSIGHSYCLPKKTTDHKYLSGIMSKLAWRAAGRMRGLGLQTGSISCGYSQTDGRGLFRSWHLPNYLYDSIDIIEQSLIIFRQVIDSPVNFLSVSLGNLVPRSGQLSIFRDEVKKTNINQAIDKINNKFGEFTLLPGNLLPYNDNAPDRIGFRKSVDIMNLEV